MNPTFIARFWWLPYVGAATAILGYALALLGCALASAMQSDRMREQVEHILSAMRACNWSKKEFAAHLGIGFPRFSKWVSGESPLDVNRLLALPESFQVAWDAARAQGRGAKVYEREEIEFFRGLSRVHLVKMALTESAKREGAA